MAVRWGWDDDDSVVDWARRNWDAFAGVDAVLITGIDSCTRICELPSVRRYGVFADSGGGDDIPVVSVSTFRRMVADEFLNGFDEFWLLIGRSSGDVVTRPPIRLQGAEPNSAPDEDLSDWMRRQGAILGVGDGWGLHYVSSDHPVAAAFTSGG